MSSSPNSRITQRKFVAFLLVILYLFSILSFRGDSSPRNPYYLRKKERISHFVRNDKAQGDGPFVLTICVQSTRGRSFCAHNLRTIPREIPLNGRNVFSYKQELTLLQIPIRYLFSSPERKTPNCAKQRKRRNIQGRSDKGCGKLSAI